MFFKRGGFEKLWTLMEKNYRDRPDCQLHYVTAWQMYQKIISLASKSGLNNES